MALESCGDSFLEARCLVSFHSILISSVPSLFGPVCLSKDNLDRLLPFPQKVPSFLAGVLE